MVQMSQKSLGISWDTQESALGYEAREHGRGEAKHSKRKLRPRWCSKG